MRSIRLGTGILLIVLIVGTSAWCQPLQKRLFRSASILQVLLDPSGEWVAAHAVHGGTHAILVQQRGAAIVAPIFSSRTGFRKLEWIADDKLYLQTHDGNARILRPYVKEGKIKKDQLSLGQRGTLIDSLVDRGDAVLWSKTEDGVSTVYRGSIEAVANGNHWFVSRERAEGELVRVASLAGTITSWLTDSAGVPRVAVEQTGAAPTSHRVIHYRSGKAAPWKVVWEPQDDDDFIYPIGMTENDTAMIVVARGTRDTMGLHTYDPAKQQLTEEIFSDPSFDIVDAVFDYDGRTILAAVYESDGLRRYRYLDGFEDEHLDEFAAREPGETVEVTSSSRDRRYFSLLVEGSRNPGIFYFYAKDTGETVKIAEVLDGIDPDDLVEVEALGVVARDGLPLETFFARPPNGRGGNPPPLVVLVHGGPIGVRDNRRFDPLLQMLALDGFAVLKVNYRGSSGYGKIFLEAGKREWSGAIEDDIEVGIENVIDRGFVDPDRICIAGASYGGYSALVSALRQTIPYRCAATLNGATDIPHLFSSSDFAETEAGRDAFAEIVGDPKAERARLLEISPAYHVDRLDVPVLIAVGLLDRRVDPDHAFRLRLMLEAHGKPFEWMSLENSGHSPSRKAYERYAIRLRGFLRKHLAPPRSALQ